MVKYDSVRNLAIDPKMLSRVERSSVLRAEQGERLGSVYGNATTYKQLARMPKEDRLTYIAISEGYINPSEIEVVTGLTPSEVSRGMSSLRKKGLIKDEEISLR